MERRCGENLTGTHRTNTCEQRQEEREGGRAGGGRQVVCDWSGKPNSAGMRERCGEKKSAANQTQAGEPGGVCEREGNVAQAEKEVERSACRQPTVQRER